jgi:hypothetical protein
LKDKIEKNKLKKKKLETIGVTRKMDRKTIIIPWKADKKI